jgi:hypothetical protein
LVFNFCFCFPFCFFVIFFLFKKEIKTKSNAKTKTQTAEKKTMSVDHHALLAVGKLQTLRSFDYFFTCFGRRIWQVRGFQVKSMNSSSSSFSSYSLVLPGQQFPNNEYNTALL